MNLFPDVAVHTKDGPAPTVPGGWARAEQAAQAFRRVWAGQFEGTPRSLHPGKGQLVPAPTPPKNIGRWNQETATVETVPNPHYFTQQWVNDAGRKYDAFLATQAKYPVTPPAPRPPAPVKSQSCRWLDMAKQESALAAAARERGDKEAARRHAITATRYLNARFI